MNVFAQHGFEGRVRLLEPGQPSRLRGGDPAGQPGRGQRVAQRGVGVQRRDVDAGQRRRQLGSGQILEHAPIVQMFDDNPPLIHRPSTPRTRSNSAKSPTFAPPSGKCVHAAPSPTNVVNRNRPNAAGNRGLATSPGVGDLGGLGLEVAAFGDAGGEPSRRPVGVGCAHRVTGNFQQMSPDGVESVLAGEPSVGVKGSD